MTSYSGGGGLTKDAVRAADASGGGEHLRWACPGSKDHRSRLGAMLVGGPESPSPLSRSCPHRTITRAPGNRLHAEAPKTQSSPALVAARLNPRGEVLGPTH